MRIVTKKICGIADIRTLSDKHADIVIFESASGDAPPGQFLNFDFVPCAGGFCRRRWVYYPYFHSSKRKDVFKGIYECVSGGSILLLKVHPDKASLSLASEILSVMDSFSSTYIESQFLLDPASIYLYLLPRPIDIPLAVGRLDDSMGQRLPYSKNDKQVAWTMRWNPVRDIMEPNLLKSLKNLLDDDMETKSDYDEFLEYSQVNNTDMFDARTALDSFKRSERVLVLDESRMWPVAFALNFGNGAVVILPENTDSESLVSEMEECDSSKTGFELLKAYSNSLSRGIVVRLNGLPASKSGALKSSTDVTYSVVIDGRVTIVTVTALCLFKFLVVWLASRSRLGIGIAFTTPLKLDEIKKTRGNGKLKIAMLAVSETKLKPLHGGELFYQSTSNISTDITDNVNNAIYDRRDIDSKEWIKLYGHTKGKDLPTVEKFSVRSVHGVRISASNTFISQLRKFRFDVSEDSKEPRKDCKEFNDNAKEFIRLLTSSLSSNIRSPANRS